MTDALERLVERFGSHTALVGVIGIGLGYVWLPQALGFAEAGFRVCGFDTDPVKS